MPKASFAGQLYESKEMELNKQIEECFHGKNGPGDLPLNKRIKNVQAVIAPHSSYTLSGPCAAWAYKEIAESEFPDLFIILGDGESNSLSIEGYETPFGLVRADREFASSLLEKNDELKVDEPTHSKNHAIEIQIPMLQFVTKDKMHEIKILPIILSDIDHKKLALDIKETLLEQKKRAIIIVSAEFTQYGRQFHHVPFSTDIKKRIYEQDRKAIEFIEKLDSDGFENFIKENMMNTTGTTSIRTLLKLLKSSNVALEQYYTSADLEEEQTYKNSSSYAAIIFN